MSRPIRDLRNALLFQAFRLLLGVGGRLPLPVLRRLGKAAGAMAMTLASKSRLRASAHLELAFPDLSSAARRRLVKGCAGHLGLNLAEIAWLNHASHDDVASQCEVTGLEHLVTAREGGRGVVLITGHCGNWELLNARLGVGGMPMVITVREVYDPRIDAIASALRERFGAEVVKRGPSAGRRLLGALSHNKVNGLLIDQDISDIPSAYVPFFNRPAWTPTGAATLALRTGAPTVPAFIHRRADGSHLVEVQPPLPIPAHEKLADRVHALTAASTAAIEAQIRRYPEQWVWMHRRWKTQPENQT